MTKETWGRYVRAISSNQSEIAERVGSSSSTVSRWVSGDVVPSAQMVIQLARAYQLSPVAALVAAGYLEPDEITNSGVQPRSLALYEFSEIELAREIVRRAEGGSTGFDSPAVVGASAQTSQPQSDREVVELHSESNVRRKASSPSKIAASDQGKK